MYRQKFIFFLILLISFNVLAVPKTPLTPSFEEKLKKFLPPFQNLSEGQWSHLRDGEIISVGDVTTKDKTQVLELFVGGTHPRNCTRAMRKLSLYENYSSYIDFIKQSQYNESAQKISFILDHTLLPFPMSLGFELPRITKEGNYPFTLKDGFLKDLKGTIIVKEVGKFCFLGLKADWTGAETKIPSVVFSTFIRTVGKLGLEHLIRVSYL